MAVRIAGLLLTALVLAACSRPLAEGERAFARDVFGDSLDVDKARVAQIEPVAQWAGAREMGAQEGHLVGQHVAPLQVDLDIAAIPGRQPI